MDEIRDDGQNSVAAHEEQTSPVSAAPNSDAAQTAEQPLPPPVGPRGEGDSQGDGFGKTAVQLAITVALAIGVFYILQFLLAALGIGGT